MMLTIASVKIKKNTNYKLVKKKCACHMFILHATTLELRAKKKKSNNSK